MSNEAEISRYLDIVYGQHQDGNLVVAAKGAIGGFRHQVIPYSQRSIAVSLLGSKTNSTHLYLAWALHNGTALQERTRRQDTALLVPGLALDIDLFHGVHAAKNLPDSAEDALGLLEETKLPAPSLVIHSGGGLYAQWLFEQPVTISDSAERSEIENLWRSWGEAAHAVWQQHGFHLDVEVCELARVFRVPGSWNPKTEPARPVTMFRNFDGVRYAVDQLQSMVACHRPEPQKGATLDSGTVRDQIARERRRPDAADLETLNALLSIFTGCRFARMCDEQAAHLPEPFWKDLADVLAHVHQGEEWFHKLSLRDPRYDYQEAQAKLDRARSYGPKRCETIAQKCSECSGCPFRFNPSVGSPVRLTAVDHELANLQRDYVLDAKTGLFFNTALGRDKSKDDFDRSYTNRMQKGVAATSFRNSRLSLIVDQHDYLIGNDNLVVDQGGWKVLNIWKEGGQPAAPGDPSIWLDEHLSYLIADPAARRWVLQYLGHLVQNPAAKIRSGIVIQSPPGAGKNLLAELFRRMFHEQDVRVLFGGILGARWQAPMGNTRLLVLDELQVDELKAAYNVLKRWVTEEFVEVERKGVDQYDVRTPRGLLIFSNHERPIAIEKKDRRLAIVRVDGEKRDQAYYERLSNIGLSPEVVAAVKHSLLTMDLDGFDPNAEPPMTDAKRDLIRVSGSILDQELETMRELELFPFDRDLYVIDDVVAALKTRGGGHYTHQRVESALRGLGDQKLGARLTLRHRHGKVARGYPWVWRRHEEWLAAPVEGIKREFASAASALPQVLGESIPLGSMLCETTVQLPN